METRGILHSNEQVYVSAPFGRFPLAPRLSGELRMVSARNGKSLMPAACDELERTH